MRSLTIGLRLCGIALEPFCCPERNGSSASRTSVRWRWRISVASRSSPRRRARWPAAARRAGRAGRPGSRPARRRARAARGRAPRSRARSPSTSRRRRSARRPRPRRTRPRAAAALRSASNANPASLMPNVVGSAWTPCVRPTQTVSTCSRARSASATTSSRAPATTISPAARSCSASAVSSTSDDVRPKWIQRPDGAGALAEHVDERGDVVVGDPLALLHRLDGERRGADRLEVVGRRPVASPRRRRPRPGATPPCAPRRSRARRSRGACSGRSRRPLSQAPASARRSCRARRS